MSSTDIELVEVQAGFTHPKSDKRGRSRFIAMRNGKPVSTHRRGDPIKYKSRDRAMNDLRNRGAA